MHIYFEKLLTFYMGYGILYSRKRTEPKYNGSKVSVLSPQRFNPQELTRSPVQA